MKETKINFDVIHPAMNTLCIELQAKFYKSSIVNRELPTKQWIFSHENFMQIEILSLWTGILHFHANMKKFIVFSENKVMSGQSR